MKISDFTWMTKYGGRDRTENAGRQIVLDFGKYHLSIIDDGYGRDSDLLEIGLFSAADGVANAMTSLPGITAEDDTVKGNLTESDVNCIIQKLYALTCTAPKQI